MPWRERLLTTFVVCTLFYCLDPSDAIEVIAEPIQRTGLVDGTLQEPLETSIKSDPDTTLLIPVPSSDQLTTHPNVRQAIDLALSRLTTTVLDYFGTIQAEGVSPSIRNRSIVALIAEEATSILIQSQPLTVNEIQTKLSTLSISGTFLADHCPIVDGFSCPPSKYRHPASYCNNVQNPHWGNSYTGYGRLIPARYGDGVSNIDSSRSSKPLPNPLDIVETIHSPEKTAPGYLTTLAAAWAQFILNDISNPVPFSDLGNKSECCSTNKSTVTCIPVVSHDKCWSYSRTAPAPRRGCSLGPREQMNGATAFLDGSAIYGNTEELADELRAFDGGFLKTSPGDLLPVADDCQINNNSCVLSGDSRVNENLALVVLHTLFLREHNRLAQRLAEVNPLWDDDTIYQEARRIVGAQLQHITYREFLPAILGENLAENLKLTPQHAGYFKDYDIDSYPATLGAAASSALSFSLAMLPPKYEIYNMLGDKAGEMSTHTGQLTVKQTEELMLGLVSSISRRVSLHIPKAIRSVNGKLDKVAEIIQRGRDHGLPSYIVWRNFCGLRQVTNFTDLSDIISSANINLLTSVYSNVNDIDLFTGALAETPLKGAVIGPTFGCILAHQFSLLRKSDRFWYENDVPPSSFNKEQLQEIRKTTLAGIICNNFENITSIPPKVFSEKDSFLNAPIPCSLISTLDIDSWASDVPALQVPEEILKLSIEKAMLDVNKRREDELKLFMNNLGADPKSPIGTAFAFSRPNAAAIVLSNTSLLLEYTSEEFLNHLEQPKFTRVKRQLGNFFRNVFARQVGRPAAQGLNNVDVTRFVAPPNIPSVCRANEETLPCDHTTPFRTFSGWCNNLRNPSFGKSLTPFNRLLPAAYDDSIARPRWRSVTGQPLPSPRLISIVVHQDVSNMHRRYTMLTTMFAQFVDHDITLTPISRGFQDAILNCRDCDSSRNVHPECWPIPIPANDPFFPRVNAQTGRPICMPFTRSLPGQQRLGAREQLNQNTAFIDASHIYGQTICEAQRLRSFTGGRLNVTLSPFRTKELLPQTNRQGDCQSPSGLCFEAGDSRAAENPGLSVLHTVMLREHNRIAGQLQLINRNWDDERIYQTSRRIINAIWQHVAFNEYLPRVLGWNAINLYGLNLLNEGYFDGYDANCNPGIFNEFASAAYRFGHSLVRPFFPRVDANFQEKPGVLLRNGFFNSEILMDNLAIDEVLRGMFMSPMENLDQFVTGEITNHLFETRNVPFSGFDLASLNLQRGRDHGLRPYNEYRAACNLKRAINFEDLSREMTPQVIERLRQVYASVDDIDLWSGGLVETPLQGGLVGPTFACIIGNQFRSLRRCDRFWYENNNQAGRFSEFQLAEIRKVTFSRIICENSDTIREITRSVFDLPHNFLNPRIPCSSLPPLDLNAWKDQDRTCIVLGRSIALGTSSLVSPCTSCTCTADGPQCQSLRVNCQQLLAEVGRDAILADNVCRVQCAFLVNPVPQAPVQTARPPVNQQRPRGGRLFPNLLNVFG